MAEPSHSDDAKLMASIATGDTAALGELVARHQEKVLALALRTLGRRDLAEDAAQDVFVKVFRAARRYRPRAKFTTWLYRIVVNHCLDMLRKAKRRKLLAGDLPPAPAEADAATQLEASETATRVRQAVGALPARQRIAIILHRYHEMSHSAIAEATGWSQSAVESLLVRAYAALRVALADLQDP